MSHPRHASARQTPQPPGAGSTEAARTPSRFGRVRPEAVIVADRTGTPVVVLLAAFRTQRTTMITNAVGITTVID